MNVDTKRQLQVESHRLIHTSGVCGIHRRPWPCDRPTAEFFGIRHGHLEVNVDTKRGGAVVELYRPRGRRCRCVGTEVIRAPRRGG